MKRLFKFKFYFPLLLLLLIALTVLINYFNYPTDWNEIKLGQKRKVIHQNIGNPSAGDLWDIKGDIWVKDHLLSWHRLDVLYNTDTVASGYSITFFLGTKTNFFRHHMKNEFNK